MLKTSDYYNEAIRKMAQKITTWSQRIIISIVCQQLSRYQNYIIIQAAFVDGNSNQSVLNFF